MASSAPELDPDALVYVERVRQATKRFGERGNEVADALQALRGLAHFDVEAPTASARREVQLVKTGVKRLSAWYMRYLSAQLDAFAANLLRLGDALVAKTDRLESGSDDLSARMSALEVRIGRLEVLVGDRLRVAPQDARDDRRGTPKQP